MTLEEKQILLKDLCARLPYKVKVDIVDNTFEKEFSLVDLLPDDISEFDNIIIKPYLRPMSNMTDKEREEYKTLQGFYRYYDALGTHYRYYDTIKSIDWLNKHYFDYRGLIPMGLALEAPKDMYKTK